MIRRDRSATEARGAGRAGERSRRVVVVAALASTLVLVLLPTGCGGGGGAKVQVVQQRTPVTHEYVIPFGTFRRLDGGEKIAIVPRVLRVKVGDTIRIRNEDTFTSDVGIFHVGPGETVTMKFKTPGKLRGACDVHPSGEFIIDVRDA